MLFVFRCHDRAQNAGARAAATSHESVTKQHDAAMNTEKPQIARMKNDPKSLMLCPYNARVSAATAHLHASRRQLQTPVMPPSITATAPQRSRTQAPLRGSKGLSYGLK